MKPIEQFEIVDHAIDHEQYFQGCGTSFTSYDDIATGIGSNFAEAVDDALEQLACSGWETEGMEQRILTEDFPGKRVLPSKPCVSSRHGDEAHYYVSIRVK